MVVLQCLVLVLLVLSRNLIRMQRQHDVLLRHRRVTKTRRHQSLRVGRAAPGGCDASARSVSSQAKDWRT